MNAQKALLKVSPSEVSFGDVTKLFNASRTVTLTFPHLSVASIDVDNVALVSGLEVSFAEKHGDSVLVTFSLDTKAFGISLPLGDQYYIEQHDRATGIVHRQFYLPFTFSIGTEKCQVMLNFTARFYRPTNAQENAWIHHRNSCIATLLALALLAFAVLKLLHWI